MNSNKKTIGIVDGGFALDDMIAINDDMLNIILDAKIRAIIDGVLGNIA